MSRPVQPLRFGVDTGGTFTDLVVSGLDGGLRLFKRPTTPDDPVRGLLDVLGAAAEALDTTTADLLGAGELFVFGTTRATNAIVESKTARTALLVTAGHPDVLTLREGGGRPSLFDYAHDYPAPYVPRALTREIVERADADGSIVTPLDEDATRATLRALGRDRVEAIAVCLLWSIVAPQHERRLGELIEAELPGIPYTLSHELNPTIREYRRASSAAIDASLKPLMSHFFGQLEQRLRDAGFGGRLLVMTSAGGVLDAAEVRRTPIHSIGSGPAAAPVAGRHFARLDAGTDTAIVTDAGGTTYDVSVVRRGAIPWTRETFVGEGPFGAMTGFPSIDARSIGAGGGSIASVDDGGLLHVGPESAGAAPGPACFGRGGTRPTVTDACLVLGFLDARFFLGGAMSLDEPAARAALRRDVGVPLGLSDEDAAAAVLHLATEHMVRAIEEITLVQGIDPTQAVVVAGGGGGGLYASAIARRLGTPRIVIPEVSAALSATGTLLSDLQTDFSITELLSTDRFDADQANAVLDRLRASCATFVGQAGAHVDAAPQIELSFEGRYPQQVWEIEVPLPVDRFDADSPERIRQAFHRVHEQLFAVVDRDSAVEIVTWRARVRLPLGDVPLPSPRPTGVEPESRTVRFPTLGRHETPVHRLDALKPGTRIAGPVIVESPVTSVIVEPGGHVERSASGSLLVTPSTLTGSTTTHREHVDA
ncbi:MAG: hydantoinase/oxoprolinase family protein [Patulibacter sp.]